MTDPEPATESPDRAWEQYSAAGKRLEAAWTRRHSDSQELQHAIDWAKERTDALARAWTEQQK